VIASILVSAAFAADEPCYGHTWDDRISGTQFWVEWDPAVIDADKAQVILEAAEHARDTYRDDLQWGFTGDPVVISVLGPQGGQGFGMAGLTRTHDCEDGAHPRIELFVAQYGEQSAVDVISHEVGHVSQYSYMGNYLDSVGSWLWWMEATATWITPYADGQQATWDTSVDDYVGQPDLALHYGLSGFLDPHTSDHMYGTAWLTEYLDEYEGGPDEVRATWEYGGTVTGAPIFFPDAVNATGVDFDAT